MLSQELEGELEERGRLLSRSKVLIESLQNDLARAQKSEDALRTRARLTNDDQTRRIAELERQLEHARIDHDARDEEAQTLRFKRTSLEDQLEEALGTVKRLELELAEAGKHQAKAAEAERTIAFQQTTLRESEAAIRADASRLQALEAEKREQTSVIRELVSTAGDLKHRRDCLELENRELRGALEEAARRHEEAMAAAEATVKQMRAATEGRTSRELQVRMAKLQGRVTELAEKEQRMLQWRTAMAEDLAALRTTAETEYSRRVEIERALHESAAIFKQQIWTKDEELARRADEVKVLKEKLSRTQKVVALEFERNRMGDTAGRLESAAERAQGGLNDTTLNTSGYGLSSMLNSSVMGRSTSDGSPGEAELSRLHQSRVEYQREMLEQNKQRLDLLGKIAAETGLKLPEDRHGGAEARGTGESEHQQVQMQEGGVSGGEGRDMSAGGDPPAWTEDAMTELSEAIGALDETLGVGIRDDAVEGALKLESK